VVDSFELSDEYSIIEVNVPLSFVGKTIQEISLRPKYNLLALTTIKNREVKSVLGRTQNKSVVQGVASPDTVLEKGDILVIYGSKKDLQTFTNQ
jgi:trk system potassium uptake protein